MPISPHNTTLASMARLRCGSFQPAFSNIIRPLFPKFRIALGKCSTWIIADDGQLLGAGKISSQAPFRYFQPRVFLQAAEVGKIVQVVHGSNVYVANNVNHILALTNKGEVWAYGPSFSNELGFLSDAVNPEGEEFIPVFTRIPQRIFPGIKGYITCIATADFYSLFLTSTGQLYGCGTQCPLIPVPGQRTIHLFNPKSIAGFSGVISQIATDEHEVFLLTNTGQLWKSQYPS